MAYWGNAVLQCFQDKNVKKVLVVLKNVMRLIYELFHCFFLHIDLYNLYIAVSLSMDLAISKASSWLL